MPTHNRAKDVEGGPACTLLGDVGRCADFTELSSRSCRITLVLRRQLAAQVGLALLLQSTSSLCDTIKLGSQPIDSKPHESG